MFQSLSSLNGRRALVTGGAGHIGKIAIETLVGLGAEVVATDLLNISEFASVSASSGLRTDSVSYFPANLTSPDDVGALVSFLENGRSQLHVLVHAAGLVGTSELSGWRGGIDDQTIGTWNLAMEVNLTSVFRLIQALRPLLSRSGSATVALISSIYGYLAPDPLLYRGLDMATPAAYFASKGGIEQLSRWLASTLSPSIRVNTICPGGIFRGQPASFVERYEAKVPLGRMGNETDLVGAIGYLCSDLSKYVTGTRIVVDGGLSIR